MDALSDPVVLARIQFAATALYHFLFVPLSVGMGLIMAIYVTRANRPAARGDAHAQALARFWVRIFTTTFAVGVATGITMEFSFGTNWADYSRFVGNIFGAPLAAEALFAFFLESVFLGVLLFGRKKVSPRFYTVSSWLVWAGSCLSALWIIIANSWMQTPAGYEIEDGKAVLTDFFEAALNNSTLQHYAHTVVALLVMGSLVCLAIGAYYLLKDRDSRAGRSMLKTGVVAGVVTTVVLLGAAHAQAVEVAQYQPVKLAAMEGQYESGPMELSLFGWVNEEEQTKFSVGIPGGTSFLASVDFDTVYQGLNDFPADEQPTSVNTVFQSYHLMVALFGVICLVLLLGIIVLCGKLKDRKWPLRIMMFGWIAPIVAIESGWITAEYGRQPWIVTGLLKTQDAVSQSVDATQLLITLALFFVIYVLMYVAWLRIFLRTVKRGPEQFLPEVEAEMAASPQAGDSKPTDGMFTAEVSGQAHDAAVATGKEA